MDRDGIDRVRATLPSVTDERREMLKRLVPEAVSEGAIDWDALRAALGESRDDAPERYTFWWAGKRDAIRMLDAPKRSTLVPVREESIDFDDTGHVFIEGDNLEVLKLLYKSYFGRVKMIYIDPPYNTGNDFVYPDDFRDPFDTYMQLTGQHDADGKLMSSNAESSGRYHSAWLSMMYPRLVLARQLLREDGVIFVSIDDHEVHNLRLLMNEIFGEENFVANVIWQKVYSPKNTARHFSEDHDYVLVYARNGATWMPSLLPRSAEADARYENPDNDPRGSWKPSDMTARNYYGEGQYKVTSPSKRTFSPPRGRYWVVNREKFQALDDDGRIWWGANGTNMPALKRFLSEVKQGIVPQTLWFYGDVGHTQEAKKELLGHVEFGHTENVLDTVKPTRLLRRMLQIGTTATPDEPEIVMDFFAGSAPLAHAVYLQNREDGACRRYVCVQIPEPLPKPEKRLRTIADIGKERIRRVSERLRAEREGELDLSDRECPEDLGVRVFRLAPSCFRQWEGDPGGDQDGDAADAEALTRQMALFSDPLRDGWRNEDVITEMALLEGYSLSSRVEKVAGLPEEVGVWRVTDEARGQSFLITLDDSVRLEDLSGLELAREDLFLCRDCALDDQTAANLALQCRLKVI